MVRSVRALADHLGSLVEHQRLRVAAQIRAGLTAARGTDVGPGEPGEPSAR